LGRSSAEAIIAERKQHGEFVSVGEFISRAGANVNKRALQGLARAGAFDGISQSRAQALHEIEGGGRIIADARAGQMSLFDAVPEIAEVETVAPLDRLDMLDMEFDTLGHYITGHPLDPLRDRVRDLGWYFSRF